MAVLSWKRGSPDQSGVKRRGWLANGTSILDKNHTNSSTNPINIQKVFFLPDGSLAIKRHMRIAQNLCQLLSSGAIHHPGGYPEELRQGEQEGQGSSPTQGV